VHIKSVKILSDKFPVKDRYPFNLKILQNCGEIKFNSNITLFAGENGTGKSTLLKAICRRCGIHIWDSDKRVRYEYNPYEEALQNVIDVEWVEGTVKGTYFGSQIFESFARLLDEWAHDDPAQLDYFGGKSLMEQSHGQALMSFFEARYKIKGLYFLDEPECALSPKTQIKLLNLLSTYAVSGQSQFIIATHSPILLSIPGAVIYNFDGEKIEVVNYKDTDHYKVYKEFMDKK
jgi:predicted ATPase